MVAVHIAGTCGWMETRMDKDGDVGVAGKGPLLPTWEHGRRHRFICAFLSIQTPELTRCVECDGVLRDWRKADGYAGEIMVRGECRLAGDVWVEEEDGL
jgi:hypothetical protein